MKEIKELARFEFGRQLVAYRNVAGISQGALAKAMNRVQPNILKIEKGIVSIGIDNMQEIATCFGINHYELANPNFPIPSKSELLESLKAYVSSKGIDTSYLDDDAAPGYAKKMDLLLATDLLNESKTAYQISVGYKEMFEESIKPSKVTDIISRSPRKDLILIEKEESGRLNIYKLKKPKQT